MISACLCPHQRGRGRHARPPPASVLMVGRQSSPIQPTARDAGRGSRATTVSRPAGFLRRHGTRDSVIRCVLARLVLMSAGEFAPELPPNSPKRGQNPASATGSGTRLLAFLGGEGGIRTPGTSKRHNGFRDRRIQPLCHLSTGASGEALLPASLAQRTADCSRCVRGSPRFLFLSPAPREDECLRRDLLHSPYEPGRALRKPACALHGDPPLCECRHHACATSSLSGYPPVLAVGT